MSARQGNDDDAANPWAFTSGSASSDTLPPDAYQQRLESILKDEPAASRLRKAQQRAEPYDIDDGTTDADLTINGNGHGNGHATHESLDDLDVSLPDQYQARMSDVLGSDEDERDGSVAGVPDNGARHLDLSSLAATSHADLPGTSNEVQSSASVNGKELRKADLSVLTEDGNSSLSSLSLRPSRPWQFPTPNRLRALHRRTESYGMASSRLSIDSSSIMAGTPSIAASSDADASHLARPMPYGDALAAKTAPLAAAAHDRDQDTSGEARHRSFFRLTRLCGLSDREGDPTVLAVASGVIAVGTKQGKIGIYSRSRGWVGAIAVEGCVSALAISSDKTFVGVGTTLGHIYLYDLGKLHAPARHVPPVSVASVKSGRGEGHLPDSKVVHLSFVGARRTAIVSADEQGLCFYHSLGKILGVSSNDTLRIMGRYTSVLEPERDSLEVLSKATILGMSPLPVGQAKHQSDENNFVALLTPVKLVIVGLKPTPRTWVRRLAPKGENDRLCGALSWLPCTKTINGISHPTLAFSFGKHLLFLQLVARSPELQIKSLASWTHSHPITAIQWLSPDLLVIHSLDNASLYDRRRAKCTEKQSFPQPVSNSWFSGPMTQIAMPTASGSFEAHKGQLFVLTSTEILTASAVSWADRILALVSSGDPLGAIRLTTLYLQEPASGGSRIGLPETFEEQRPIIATRLLELMRASTAYIFSESRMKDDMIHYENGVDRTPLFEDLARACAQGCIALQDFAFLFDELYDAFSDAGIEGIFADQMEDFIVSGSIRDLPIPIVKRLIDFRRRQERYDLAEVVIRNVDPQCLDLDQVISLCLEQHLYDALIHVYTRSLHDYVGPIVELLPLVNDHEEEGYRLFSYLSITLIGLTYPEQDALAEAEAHQARSTVYRFLFSGRCTLWPEGPGGRLVLSKNGTEEEPTFPYVRLLLEFDAEAFLDALDVAFEDTWLDDDAQWSRQHIVALLLDLSDILHEARLFISIFIARNAPKYPQFVKLSAEKVDSLILNLASSFLEDEDTREDRQYAVECLLSTHQTRETARLLEAFEKAGFQRILKRAYRREGQWSKLASLIVSQPTPSLFSELEDVVKRSKGDKQTISAILRAIPALVDADAQASVALLEKYFYNDLDEAVETLDRSPHRQLAILDGLLDSSSKGRTSSHLRGQYVGLLCSLRPHEVVAMLDRHDPDFFEYTTVATMAESEDVHDAQIWALDKLGKVHEALNVFRDVLRENALVLRAHDDSDTSFDADVAQAQEQIESTARMAVRICSEHGKEELWVDVLQKLIRLAHDTHESKTALAMSRTLLQDALGVFVSSSAADDLSFAQLFEGLVPEEGSTYAEVRDISEAMTDAYRLRQDVSSITTSLLGRDVFGALQKLTRLRRRGWRPQSGAAVCQACKEPCFVAHKQPLAGDEGKSPRMQDLESSFSAARHLPSKSPSYLEPTFSPRPDKGKGVVRDRADSDEINATTRRVADPDAATDDRDFFATSDASGRPISTPAELFSSTPLGADMSGNFGDSTATTAADDSVLVHDDGANSEADKEDEDDIIVVCFDGQVYHRRCAPTSMLQ